jgi:hypothetical protein
MSSMDREESSKMRKQIASLGVSLLMAEVHHEDELTTMTMSVKPSLYNRTLFSPVRGRRHRA